MNDFGKTLQRLREDRGLSQRELAKKVNVSTGAIGNYESGLRMPKFVMLEAFADVFNVPMGVLLGESETSRMAMYYDKLKDIIEKAYKLDDVDRAKIEERIDIMLESDKYQED